MLAGEMRTEECPIRFSSIKCKLIICSTSLIFWNAGQKGVILGACGSQGMMICRR